jgi:predicted transport protein
MPAPRTPQEMLKVMISKLEPETGKTFEQWVVVAQKSGLEKHKALTDHMKKSHGLNHNQAQWIAWGVTDPGRIEQYDKPQDLVANLYSGKKEHLRPIYDALLQQGLGLDDDVSTNVCKTYTSLAAGTQFAIVVPKTQKSVDLELALPPQTQVQGRLEEVKSSNPKFTFRVRISDISEVDDEVTALMQKASDFVRK